MNQKLSVIIPYAQEGANTIFTCRAVHEELQDIPHEIIAIDNMCDELKEQLSKKGESPDRYHEHNSKDGTKNESHIKSMAKINKWLKYMQFTSSLSHWKCKNHAIQNTDADIFMFVDAHCLPSKNSILGMYAEYVRRMETGPLTMHLPLTYHILEDRRLVYNLSADLDNGFVGYTFAGARRQETVYEIPCMSSCGSMISRETHGRMFGAWSDLYSYGGGENIMNYVTSIQGIPHFIYNKGTLFHHGCDRGYHWTWLGFHYNRAAAMYLIGGRDFLEKYIHSLKGNMRVLNTVMEDVLKNNSERRASIKELQTISIEDYVRRWE